VTRIYFPDPIPADGRCQLDAPKAHHVSHVLRLKVGDAVILFDGRGTAYDAQIAQCQQQTVSLVVQQLRIERTESPLRVNLVQAVSSGDRMDYTIQKAVELGVNTVQPVLSARCVVKLSGERADKRIAHWQAVVIAACEQSGRLVVPEVKPLLRYTQYVEQALPDGEIGLLLDPLATNNLRAIAPLPGDAEGRAAVSVLVGPEGGLTADEVTRAIECGYQAIRLGPRILRTETAAVALLAAMQVLWGDF